MEETHREENGDDRGNMLTRAWALSLLGYPLLGIIVNLFPSSGVRMIVGYGYMTLNFLLYLYALYNFPSYWKRKKNKTIGVFYLLLLLVNTLIAYCLAGYSAIQVL